MHKKLVLLKYISVKGLYLGRLSLLLFLFFPLNCCYSEIIGTETLDDTIGYKNESYASIPEETMRKINEAIVSNQGIL
jgi:hypothetical protein